MPLPDKTRIVLNAEDLSRREYSRDEFHCLRKEMKRFWQKKDQENTEFTVSVLDFCNQSIDRSKETADEYMKMYHEEESKARKYEKMYHEEKCKVNMYEKMYLEEEGKANMYEKMYLEEKGKAEKYEKMCLQLKEEVSLLHEWSDKGPQDCPQDDKLNGCGSSFTLSDWFLT